MTTTPLTDFPQGSILAEIPQGSILASATTAKPPKEFADESTSSSEDIANDSSPQGNNVSIIYSIFRGIHQAGIEWVLIEIINGVASG